MEKRYCYIGVLPELDCLIDKHSREFTPETLILVKSWLTAVRDNHDWLTLDLFAGIAGTKGGFLTYPFTLCGESC